MLTAIHQREIDLIINIPSRETNQAAASDGFKIRRMAIDCHIPLITNMQLAIVLLQALAMTKRKNYPKALAEYSVC